MGISSFKSVNELQWGLSSPLAAAAWAHQEAATDEGMDDDSEAVRKQEEGKKSAQYLW